MLKKKFYLFIRNKKEKSVITTHYNKFLNLLMRKGLKNRQISFLINLLRGHKLRLKKLCFSIFKTYSFDEIPNKVIFPTFPKLLKVVFRLITLKLELKHKNFRQKEILIPSPLSPWRGMRLGLNLLLKNSMNLSYPKNILRKNKKMYQILTEFWQTFRNKSTTCISIEDFTSKVLENSENFRLTRLFPVNKFRRCVVPELKILDSKESKESKMYSRDKFLAFLTEYKLNAITYPTFYNLKIKNPDSDSFLNSFYNQRLTKGLHYRNYNAVPNKLNKYTFLYRYHNFINSKFGNKGFLIKNNYYFLKKTLKLKKELRWINFRWRVYYIQKNRGRLSSKPLIINNTEKELK